MTTVAWYAAYGSNTDEARFRQYLAGCTQPCDPADSRPLTLDLPLYFAGSRTRWGDGGVAFLGPERDLTPTTLARAWLLPVDRIAEVGAQENRLPIDRAQLDLDAVVADGVASVYDGWYDAWVVCGELDGIPVVTLTASTTRSPQTPPARGYVEVVARGLRTTHGMTRKDVAAYLKPRTKLATATLMEWQSGGSG
ncbi:MAG: hypothetical protein QOD30_2158 [Actinomycetota bacterium]|nr:hypothetical protein [Actinomycetota bacterium]